MCHRILVIDDDPEVSALLTFIRKVEGVEVKLERDLERALALLKSEHFDVLFANVQMSGRSEFEVIREARQIRPNLPVVVVTAVGTVESTVSAFRLGVVDYLTKPFQDEQVSAALKRASTRTDQREAILPKPQRWNAELVADRNPINIVAQSQVMARLAAKSIRIAESNRPLLVVGELGVGKERIVRWIHSLNSRRDNPFIKVNCEAIQESQLAKVFFGDESAVTSGAIESPRRGLIDQAAGGMLLLKNVTGLPKWMQEMLLNAAQEGTYVRNGGSEHIPFRARIAASLRRDPAECVRKGLLLDELHCYLDVAPLYVPPLRERREDIRPLISALVQEVSCDSALSSQWANLSFTEEAMQLLENFDWMGNVYELGNFIRRLFVFADGPEIMATDVAEMMPAPKALVGTDTITVPFVGDLKVIERAIVAEVINRAHGNKSAAARSLGLHRKTLYRIIENDSSEPLRRASG